MIKSSTGEGGELPRARSYKEEKEGGKTRHSKSGTCLSVNQGMHNGGAIRALAWTTVSTLARRGRRNAEARTRVGGWPATPSRILPMTPT